MKVYNVTKEVIDRLFEEWCKDVEKNPEAFSDGSQPEGYSDTFIKYLKKSQKKDKKRKKERKRLEAELTEIVKDGFMDIFYNDGYDPEEMQRLTKKGILTKGLLAKVFMKQIDFEFSKDFANEKTKIVNS